MPIIIYPSADKKATLHRFKHRLYRAWRDRKVFGEGVIDLSRLTFRRTKQRVDQRAIAKAIADKIIVLAPETALPAAIGICGRLNPPVQPDIVVSLPRKQRHTSRIAGYILDIFATDHLAGFKLTLARTPFSPLIAILQPVDRKSGITLVNVTESGRPSGTYVGSWPSHVLNQVRRLSKAFTADLTVWSHPKSVAAWRHYFKDARIQALKP